MSALGPKQGARRRARPFGARTAMTTAAPNAKQTKCVNGRIALLCSLQPICLYSIESKLDSETLCNARFTPESDDIVTKWEI
jgi:hypothetical protein